MVSLVSVLSNSASITPPAGFTERSEASRGSTLEASDAVQAAAGATGAKVSTSSVSAANIGVMVALKPAASPLTVKFDSFRSVANGAFTHWSDWDAHVLGWCKSALYAAGVKSGTQWRFFAAGSLATSTEIFVLPDGWVVTDIVDMAGWIYFSASRGQQGVIYAYDGINPPFIAVPQEALAAGDIPLALGPFYGAGLLVGCRRPSATGSGGQGVLYRAFPTADGHLSAEELHTIGVDDGKDYGIKCARQIGKYAYYGYSFPDSSSSGLGFYWPETGAYTRNLDAAVSGSIVDVVTFKGRKIFSVDGVGVYVEQATYVDSGYIISSTIDANVSPDKTWLVEELDFDLKSSLTAACTMEYSSDGGVTWNGLQASTSGTARLRSGLDVKSPRIQYRTTLLPDSGLASAPDLTFAGIGGWPAQKPTLKHTMEVRAFATSELRDGEQLDDKSLGWTLLNNLLTRWATGEVYDYQPPWFGLTGTSVKVRISGVTPWNGWGLGGDRQGGNITLELKEVEAILS